MKWIDIKEILDEQFPAEGAIPGDIIGEQYPCPEEVTKIITTLDVTLDVIAQAKEFGAEVIISHHPFYWGEDRQEALSKNFVLKAIDELLTKEGIGLYTAHTNADYAPNSLAFMQALALDLINVDQNDQNLSVTGYLPEPRPLSELVELFRERFELKDFPFRTNVDPITKISKITFASGTAGEYGIVLTDNEALHVIGEIKHHEWVQGKQAGVKILELTHFSETIFKSMVKVLLNDEDVEVILSKEENGYKII